MSKLKILKTIRKGTMQVVADAREGRHGDLRFREKVGGRWKYLTQKDTRLKLLKKTYPSRRFSKELFGPRAGLKYGPYQGAKSPTTQRRAGMGMLKKIGQGGRQFKRGIAGILAKKGAKKVGLGAARSVGAKLAARGALGVLGPLGSAAMLAWLGYDVASAGLGVARSAESDQDILEGFVKGQYQDELAGELGSELASTRSESEYIGNMAELSDTDRAMTRALHTNGSSMNPELQMLVGGDTRVLQELAQQPAEPGLAEIAAQYGAL